MMGQWRRWPMTRRVPETRAVAAAVGFAIDAGKGAA